MAEPIERSKINGSEPGGPETELQFAQGHSATAPFNYANWSAVEPNNSGGAEHYAVVQLGNSASVPNGQWGDNPLGGAGQVGTYIIEYPVPEPSSVLLLSIGVLRLLTRKLERKNA